MVSQISPIITDEFMSLHTLDAHKFAIAVAGIRPKLSVGLFSFTLKQFLAWGGSRRGKGFLLCPDPLLPDAVLQWLKIAFVRLNPNLFAMIFRLLNLSQDEGREQENERKTEENFITP